MTGRQAGHPAPHARR